MALFFVVFCARGVRSANIASRAAWLRRYQNQDYVRDLAEAKHELEDACQRSEDANRAKQQFLANISHEVRTPLNGILGMTSLVLDAPLEQTQREHMGTLKRCGENLLRLVDDLLDFSRIEAGRMEIEAIDFDLRVLLDELVEEHSLNALSKGEVEVCLEWAEAAPRRVIGDPVRLRQVLNNLLANAIKFTERGEVALCAWRSASPAGEQLVLQVADQGIGIPEDRREAVFESFTQADGTTTRNYGGTGLGLAISRQLVERMGGCITLESEVGIGSVFTVHLPLRLSADRTDVPPMQVLLAGVGECHGDLLRAAGWEAVCCPFDTELWLEARRLFRFPESQRLLACSAEDLRANRGLVEALQRHTDCRLVVVGSDSDTGAAFAWNPEEGVEPLLKAFVGHGDPAAAEVRGGPLTVLLAEDDETNALLARIHLEACGHLVHVARDGEEAVRMFRVLRPDLVLMDCQMPKLDGIEATRRIRSLADGSDVPIVALTAHDRPEDRERFAAAGMDGHIRKPFERRALDAALQRASARAKHVEDVPET
jgi:signal transduction histidine kinase/CheY-like chemotaxis protein